MKWLLLVSGCVWLCVSPGVALARRPAKPVERRAITRSVRLYTHASGCCAAVPIRVLSPIWISTKDPDFAAARIKAVGSTPPGPRATVILVHTYSRRWVVIALGSARLACAVPAAVRSDLRLPSCG